MGSNRGLRLSILTVSIISADVGKKLKLTEGTAISLVSKLVRLEAPRLHIPSLMAWFVLG